MRLIINADDYGWDKDANLGIISLVRGGGLSSVSIMANLADDDALKNIAVHTQTISTGIHVTLNEGKPITDPRQVRSLLDEEGCFLNSSQLWSKVLSRKIKEYHVTLEIRNQMRRLRDFGIDISHADSHQHLHQYPFLGKMILQTLRNEGIKRVRRCRPENATDFRRVVLADFHLLSQNHLRPFKTPDVLVTSFAHKRDATLSIFQDSIQSLLKRKYNCAECMCHPALDNRGDSYLNRKAEYSFLMFAPWQEILEEEGVELINYKQL
jgi:chitin disaccharide deacetylase